MDMSGEFALELYIYKGDNNLDDIYKSEVISLLWPDNCSSTEKIYF